MLEMDGEIAVTVTIAMAVVGDKGSRLWYGGERERERERELPVCLLCCELVAGAGGGRARGLGR